MIHARCLCRDAGMGNSSGGLSGSENGQSQSRYGADFPDPQAPDLQTVTSSALVSPDGRAGEMR